MLSFQHCRRFSSWLFWFGVWTLTIDENREQHTDKYWLWLNVELNGTPVVATTSATVTCSSGMDWADLLQSYKCWWIVVMGTATAGAWDDNRGLGMMVVWRETIEQAGGCCFDCHSSLSSQPRCDWWLMVYQSRRSCSLPFCILRFTLIDNVKRFYLTLQIERLRVFLRHMLSHDHLYFKIPCITHPVWVSFVRAFYVRLRSFGVKEEVHWSTWRNRCFYQKMEANKRDSWFPSMTRLREI